MGEMRHEAKMAKWSIWSALLQDMRQTLKQQAQRMLSGLRFPCRTKGECCIFKPDGLGDLVLASGAIEQLNLHFGAENCTLITSHLNHSCAEFLFPRNPKICAGHTFEGLRRGEPLPSLFRVMPKLSQVRFDTLVCLRHQRSEHLSMLLGWIKTQKQYGMTLPEGASWDRFHGGNLLYPKLGTQEDGVCLELEAHATVLAQCLGVQLTGKDLKPKLSTMTGKDYVLFNPYASKEQKQYPIPKWAEIIESHRKREFRSGLPG